MYFEDEKSNRRHTSKKGECSQYRIARCFYYNTLNNTMLDIVPIAAYSSSDALSANTLGAYANFLKVKKEVV